MASTEGGMDIEEVAREGAREDPQARPSTRRRLQASRRASSRSVSGLTGAQQKAVRRHRCAALVRSCSCEDDCSLVEINPLVVTKDGKLLALDAKINFDDNALFRHPEARRAARRDRGGRASRSRRASRPQLHLARRQHRLPGQRRRPRDGHDGHHQAPRRRAGELPRRRRRRHAGAVTEAFKIILVDPNVKGILVNIFGGIVQCDMIAEGVITAVKQVGLQGAGRRAARRHERREGPRDARQSGLDDHCRRPG